MECQVPRFGWALRSLLVILLVVGIGIAAPQAVAEGNQAPVAGLSTSTSLVDLATNLTFSGADSYDTDGSVTHYYFNWGDGQSTGWIVENEATHAWTTEGQKVVSLQVRDDESLVSEAVSITITVSDIPTVTLGETVISYSNLTVGVQMTISQKFTTDSSSTITLTPSSAVSNTLYSEQYDLIVLTDSYQVISEPGSIGETSFALGPGDHEMLIIIALDMDSTGHGMYTVKSLNDDLLGTQFSIEFDYSTGDYGNAETPIEAYLTFAVIISLIVAFAIMSVLSGKQQ